MKKVIFPQSGFDVSKGAALAHPFLSVNVLFRRYFQPSEKWPTGMVYVTHPQTGAYYTPKTPEQLGLKVVEVSEEQA